MPSVSLGAVQEADVFSLQFCEANPMTLGLETTVGGLAILPHPWQTPLHLHAGPGRCWQHETARLAAAAQPLKTVALKAKKTAKHQQTD